MNRREFIGGATAATLLAGCGTDRAVRSLAGFTPPKIGDIRSVLLHLGTNMWTDRAFTEIPEFTRKHDPTITLEDIRNVDYHRFDEGCWRELTGLMAKHGLNQLVVDIGEGMVLPSHPELAVRGAWSPDRMREEIVRLNAMGIEVIPKLNFSTSHDTWLGVYHRMVSTRKYYQVCADVIRDCAEIFESPRFFHIGYDEEMWTAQKTRQLVIIRQKDLWWHDFLYTVNEVERNGSRAICWSDVYWTGRDEFKKRMPKSVLQCNWYYRSDFSEKKMVWNEKFEKEGGWGEGVHGAITFLELEKAGYDQLAGPGNFWGEPAAEAVVKFCKEHVDPSRLKGFLMSTWAGTTQAEKKKVTDGIREFAAVKRKYYS